MFQKVTSSKNFKKAAVILMLFAFLAQPLIMPAVAWAENTNIVNGSTAKGALQSYDSKYNTPLSYATKDGAVALGVGTYATAKNSFSMGNYVNASGIASVAMGKYVNATGAQSAGFGNNVTAEGSYAFAAGNKTTAKGIASFAMGQGTYANGSNSVAMGSQTFAMSDSAVAMGKKTNASGNASFAMGDSTSAAGAASFSMGYATVSEGSYSMAIGYKTYSVGNYSVAMGNGNNASEHGAITGGGVLGGSSAPLQSNPNTASGYNAVAFGEGSTASGDDSFVMGKNAKAMGKYSVAMGQNATAAVDNSFAFGGNAGGANAVALGFGSNVTGANSVAIGSTSVATKDNEVSVGYYNSSTDYRYRKVTNVAAGDLSATSTDAVVGSQLNATNVKVATNAANITTNKNAITTINNSAVMKSGITSTKVGSYDTHVANNDIHVTAAQKTAWTAKQDALTTAQLAAANSGITADKVTAYDGYSTYITASGLNANSKKITGVLAGSADTDAVNYGQIKGTYNNATYANDKLTLTRVDGSTTELTISGGSGGVTEDVVKGYSTLTVNGVSVNKSTGLELVGGTNVTISADQSTGKITFNATGGGSGSVDFAAAKGFATNVTPSVSGEYALGVGYNATASHAGSVALGYASCTTGDYEVSVGTSSQTRKITNVTAGTEYTDAATVKQTQLWVEEAGTGVRKNISNENGVKLTSSDNSVTFGTTTAGTLDIKATGGSGGTDSNAVHYDIESAQRQNSITLKDTEDGTTAQVAIKNVASAGELSGMNTNASTGADVYNATTVTTASVQSSRYAADSKVTDAVKALDTAIGDMSCFTSQNYAKDTTNVAANITALDTAIGDMSGFASQNYAKNTTNVAANITALDSQVKTNADAIATITGGTAAFTGTSYTAGTADATKVEIADNKVAVGGKSYITNAGLNANDKKITGVATGSVACGSTDAVNGGQLYTEQQARIEAVTGATLKSVTLGDDKKTLTVAENSTNKTVDLSDLVTTQGNTNATNIATNAENITKNATDIVAAVKQSAIYVKDPVLGKVNTAEGVTFVAGENVELNAINGKITISATGGSGKTIAEYTAEKELTFKDENGKTDTGKILLKNVEIEGLPQGKKVAGDDREAEAVGAGAIASGYNAYATGDKSIAYGYGAWTDEDAKNAIGIGVNATAIGEDSVATGNGAIADEANAVAVGNSAYAGGKSSIATGNEATASGDASVATGNGAIAKADNSIAIGNGANVSNMGTSSIAVGDSSTVSGEQSIAIGVGNVVEGNNSGAFGDPNIVMGNRSYAIGNNNTILGSDTFVLGNSVNTSANNAVVLGNNSTATRDNTVSVGAAGAERQITNVAPGTFATDAANMNQLWGVEKEARQIAAMSAALAGLHYMEPSGEGDDRVTGAVAYGGYRGENAAAVGIAYKPNQNMMFSASTSIGNDHQPYNAGMSFRFGKGGTVTRTELAKQIKYVNEQNKKLKETNDTLHCEVMSLKNMTEEQNDKIEQQSRENAQLRSELNELKNLVRKMLNK